MTMKGGEIIKMTFEEACRLVEAVLESRWKSAEETERMMRLEK